MGFFLELNKQNKYLSSKKKSMIDFLPKIKNIHLLSITLPRNHEHLQQNRIIFFHQLV